MRLLAAILAIGGLPWAYFAAILVAGPIGIFIPAYRYSSADIALSIIYAALALLGFFVWAGWLKLATKKKYLVRSWIFWSLSAINHLSWLIVFKRDSGGSSWLDIYPLCWLIVNLVLAVVLSVLEFRKEKQPNQRATDNDGVAPRRV
jgi:hypothetical protein